MSAIIELNEANFDREILQGTETALVDFWAPWCGPCRQLTPVLEEVAESFGERVKFAKVNTDENADLMKRYGISAIPALLLFREGKIVDRVVGFMPKHLLAEMLGSAPTASPIPVLTDADLDRITSDRRLLIVACGEPNDGDYRISLDTFVKAEKDSGGQATFFACDTLQAPNFRERYDALQTCVLLLCEGQVIDRFRGALTSERLTSMLSALQALRPVPEVAEENFRARVLQSPVPVLVDACGPASGLYRRAFDVIQRAFPGRIEYAKLNVHENPHIAARYGLPSAVDTLLLFKDGRVVVKLYNNIGSEALSEETVIALLGAWENEPVAEIRDYTRSGADFREQIVQGSRPAFGYFGSSWMGSESRLMRLAKQRFPDLRLFRLDVNEYNGRNLEHMLRREVPSKAQHLLPPTVPETNEAFVLFKSGKIVYRSSAFVRELSQENEALARLEGELDG